MLNHIDTDAVVPRPVAIFTKPGCGYCARARKLLSEHGLAFDEIVLGTDATVVGMKAVAGRDSAPQVFIDGNHVGGFEDLRRYLGQSIPRVA